MFPEYGYNFAFSCDPIGIHWLIIELCIQVKNLNFCIQAAGAGSTTRAQKEPKTKFKPKIFILISCVCNFIIQFCLLCSTLFFFLSQTQFMRYLHAILYFIKLFPLSFPPYFVFSLSVCAFHVILINERVYIFILTYKIISVFQVFCLMVAQDDLMKR